MTVVGLYLKDDDFASASTLGTSAGLTNGQTNNQDGTGGYIYDTDSYGIDAGQASHFNGVRIWAYNSIWSANGTVPTGWYGSNYDSFELWSSDDNASWSYHETLDAPAITVVKSGKSYVDLALTSAEGIYCRYMKVRFYEVGGEAYNAAYLPGGVSLIIVEIEQLNYASDIEAAIQGLSMTGYGYHTLYQNLYNNPTGQSITGNASLSMLIDFYAKAYSHTADALLTGSAQMNANLVGQSHLDGYLGGSYLLSSHATGQSHTYGSLGLVGYLYAAIIGHSHVKDTTIGKLYPLGASIEGQSLLSEASLIFLLRAKMEGHSLTNEAILSGLMKMYNNYSGLSYVKATASDLITQLRSMITNHLIEQIYNITSIAHLEIISQILVNSLAIPYEKIVTMLNNLGGDPITIFETILNELASANIETQYNTVSNTLDEGITGRVVIHTDPESGSYEVGNTVTGQDSGAVGSVVAVGTGYIEVTTSDMFTPGELIDSGSLTSIISQIRTYYDKSIVIQPYFNVYFTYDNGKTASITKAITSMELNYNIDSIHNEIVLTSSDESLYLGSTASVRYGETRIILQLGDREISFLFEKKTGNSDQFELSGRSISALDSSPYTSESTYAPGTIFNAVDYIESNILSARAIDLVDADLNYVVADSWSFTGTPTEAANDLLERVGGIIRATDSGYYEIRKRTPYIGEALDKQRPDIELTASNDIIEIDFNQTEPSDYNKVKVIGYTPDIYLPDISTTPSGPNIGDPVTVKVYWGGYTPLSLPDTYSTADGNITFLGIRTEENTQEVTFINGTGSVSKPIYDITRVEWYGNPPLGIDRYNYIPNYTVNEKVITLTDSDLTEDMASRYGIANVVYRSQYWEYLISGTNVEKLLAVFQVSAGDTTSAIVAIKDALSNVDSELDVWLDDIEDPILYSQTACKLRGETELVEDAYMESQIVINSPYQKSFIDGNILYINDVLFSVIGNCLITDVTISFSNGKIDTSIIGERKSL